MIELEFFHRGYNRMESMIGNSFSEIYEELGNMMSSEQPTFYRDVYVQCDMPEFDSDVYSELLEKIFPDEAIDYFYSFVDKIPQSEYKNFIIEELQAKNYNNYKITYSEYLLDSISNIINKHGGEIVENEEIFNIYFPNDINLLSTEVNGKNFEYNVDLENFTVTQVYGKERFVENFNDLYDLWIHLENLDTQKMITVDLASAKETEVNKVVDKEKDLLDKDLDNDGVIDRYDTDPRDNSVQSFGQLEERDKNKVEGIDKVISGKEDADIQTRKSRDELEL